MTTLRSTFLSSGKPMVFEWKGFYFIGADFRSVERRIWNNCTPCRTVDVAYMLQEISRYVKLHGVEFMLWRCKNAIQPKLKSLSFIGTSITLHYITYLPNNYLSAHYCWQLADDVQSAKVTAENHVWKIFVYVSRKCKTMLYSCITCHLISLMKVSV